MVAICRRLQRAFEMILQDHTILDHHLVVAMLGDIVVQDMMNLLRVELVVAVACTEITATRNVVTILLQDRCTGIIVRMSVVVMRLVVIMIHHPLDIEKGMVHWEIILVAIDTYLHRSRDEMVDQVLTSMVVMALDVELIKAHVIFDLHMTITLDETGMVQGEVMSMHHHIHHQVPIHAVTALFMVMAVVDDDRIAMIRVIQEIVIAEKINQQAKRRNMEL